MVAVDNCIGLNNGMNIDLHNLKNTNIPTRITELCSISNIDVSIAVHDCIG